MSLNPQHTYVLLNDNGAALAMPGGEQFWRLSEAELAQSTDGWLVSEYLFDTDWPTWEMHPRGDELVYLLSGAATLHFERPDGIEHVALRDNGAVVVPRGVWHTLKVLTPCRMLNVTRGAGTQSRRA